MCGTDFSARSDAVYCSSACRQKAHRARTAHRIANLHALVSRAATPALADPNATGKSLQQAAASSIQRAREQVERSRELCRISTERLQQGAVIQQQFGNEAADVATTHRPICTRAVLWRGNQTAELSR